LELIDKSYHRSDETQINYQLFGREKMYQH